MSKKRRHQKFVSAAVRVANQANAQLSTGPRTEAGKAVAAMNARKHGLTAKHFVIAPGEEAIFETFRNSVVEEIQPRTETEWMLFEDILTGRWNMRRVDLAEVHLFQTTGFDPLRNPDPAIEKRHKRLMSYRRMWQRTWEKAHGEIQRHRDMDAELAAQEAEATPEQTPEDDLRKRSQTAANPNPINNLPEILAAGGDEIGPNDPTLEQVSTRISSSEPGGPQKELSARHNPPGSGDIIEPESNSKPVVSTAAASEVCRPEGAASR